MSASVENILGDFDRLPDAEKKEVAAEIIKRTLSLDIPPLTDEEIVYHAEALFLELDKRELEDEQLQ